MGVPILDWSVPVSQDVQVGEITESCWEAWHQGLKWARHLSSLPFGFPKQCLALDNWSVIITVFVVVTYL